MGFMSGEYGGRYRVGEECNSKRLTITMDKLSDLIRVVNSCIIHYEDATWSRKWVAHG